MNGEADKGEGVPRELQRSTHPQPFVDHCCAHRLVGGVIISNVLPPLEYCPRWPVGIVGPSWSAMNGVRDGRPRFVPAHRMPPGFGTLMFTRADSSVRIPDGLLILGGDDLLFEQQTHRDLQMVGARIGTQWSLTSPRADFDATKERDREVLRAKSHTGRTRTGSGSKGRSHPWRRTGIDSRAAWRPGSGSALPRSMNPELRRPTCLNRLFGKVRPQMPRPRHRMTW